jgi:hypothetical protein
MTSPVVEAQLHALLDERDREFDPPPLDPAVCEVLGPSGAAGTPHRRLLEICNGAFLYGRALHFFGACARPPWHSLAQWNARETWRDAYRDLTDGLIFFAEDAFGDQFAYTGRGGEVVVFEAELGKVVHAAPTFMLWIESILAAPESLLPIELLKGERAAGKNLQAGSQLFAYPPLFSVESREGVEIGHVDAIEAMRFRGQLALQVRDMPSGTQVKIEIDDT